MLYEVITVFFGLEIREEIAHFDNFRDAFEQRPGDGALAFRALQTEGHQVGKGLRLGGANLLDNDPLMKLIVLKWYLRDMTNSYNFV